MKNYLDPYDYIFIANQIYDKIKNEIVEQVNINVLSNVYIKIHFSIVDDMFDIVEFTCARGL